MKFWRKIIWHFFDMFGCRTCKKVKLILKTEKIDVVITHNLKGFSYQIPRLINKLKIRHIHTLHDYQLIDPHGSLYRHGHNLITLGLPIKIYKELCKILFSKIDIVVSPSKFILEKHLDYGFFKNSKTQVLPNPVVLPAVAASRSDSEKMRLLYLGQLEEHKGIRFLLEAFRTLPLDKFELLIAGKGKIFSDLKKNYQQSNIVFLGSIPHGEINRLFEQTDITVIPSLWWDNSPSVIYESYAYNRPVLVSDAGGSKELVIEGKTGYIFKSGDQSSFLSILNKIAQNKPNLGKLGVSGHEFVSQFSLDRYLSKIIELCQNLIK